MKNITLQGWKNRKFVEWESIRNYPSNTVAISRTTGELYALCLTADDIVWWMEFSDGELILDVKLTADTTDDELNEYTDQICAEYIAHAYTDQICSEYMVSDWRPESRYSDHSELTDDEIYDLYDRCGLPSMVYQWLETGREALRGRD